jgi:DnaJ-class molecular chaperone
MVAQYWCPCCDGTGKVHGIRCEYCQGQAYFKGSFTPDMRVISRIQERARKKSKERKKG